MPRHVSAFRKHHGPGDVRRPAVQFTVYEIADPAEAESYGSSSRDEVGNFQKLPASPAADVPRRQGHSHEPAVERHAALPDCEDGHGSAQITAEVIKQHVAEAAADHYSED